MNSSTNLEVVEKLLQSTGLSCDDLLAKLQEYKAKQTTKSAKDSSEATKVPKEQPSVDQQFKLADENPVIVEAKSSNSSDNAPENIVNLNTNCDDNVDTKTVEIVSDHSSNTENYISCKNSNIESAVVTINQTVKDAPEEEILENRTSSDNNIDNVLIDTITNEVVEKEIPNSPEEQILENFAGSDKNITSEVVQKEIPCRRNSDCFEDFLFCQEKGDDISDSIKGNVEDILRKLALQDSENKSENVSAGSITNDEDCFDSTSFHHSDDSSSCQKDDLQDKEDNVSNNNTEINEKTAENVPGCPSIEDHNYSNPKNKCHVEENHLKSNTEEASKTEEDLRNIIRMQLSSLRNMKKSNTYLPDLQKRRSVFFHNLKKKRKSCDINPARPLSSNSNESNCKSTEENKTDSIKEADVNDDPLVSLSDETGFVILNVTGGVDRVTEENAETTSVRDEQRSFGVVAETNGKPKMRYGSISPMKQEKKLLTIKNYSGTFSEDPGINKSVKNSEKSPFVSDSLEDFLNESSQLKISYSIPKLGAEDGIGESTKKSPFDGVVGKAPRIEQDLTPAKGKPKLIKAKTLAEMRRQIEKLQSNKKVHYPLQVKKVEPIKEESEDNSKASILQEYNINVVPRHRNSFVVYNKKKMWVSTSAKSKCVAVIDFPRRENIAERTTIPPETPKVAPIVNRKLSLLSTLNQKKPCKIRYKPGPLCKKVELQNIESRDTWTTELKTLPKIYLEVIPEVNKPIDPDFVHLLPVFDDCVITDERANFALSVLKSKNETVKAQAFNFLVPYNNNQEKMLVRKRCEPIIYKPDVSITSSNDETDPAIDIANILEDIVRYIEVKEIEDTLIKEDDMIIKEEPQIVNTSPKTKPRKHKRKKLDLELARLSCKVIDVKTETVENKECTKPYCKMGCVCKSLLCDSVFSDHCQLVECMFGCRCPPTNDTSASNNSLSAHTVTHLEDKAKKNLAKVEREFTQTLIHTDNDVILVGAKGRNRGRATKVPKKFNDFIGSLDEIMLDDPQHEVQEKPKFNLMNCTVNVPKLNLDYIIPYCLYHHVYDCDCKGEMIDFPTSVEKVPKIRIVKTKEDLHKSWYSSCARIRLFPEYRKRNKDPKYTEKLRANNVQLQWDSRFRITDSDIKEEFSPEDIILSNFRVSSETTPPKKPSKRKQSFNIREDVINSSANVARSTKRDVEKEFALQRRKKKLKPNGNFNDNCIASTYHPIFDGEIRVNLKDNQDMLKIIGEENSSLEYLRILPWTKVIESFQSRKLNIWTKEKRSSALLCNAAGYFPPKYFVDIRRVHHRSDIVNWILSDNLPPDRPRELMHLILTPRKDHFVISGYCLKKVESENSTEQSLPAYLEDGSTSDTAKFVSDIAPACVKLEPTDPDEISTCDEYSENPAVSEQVTEQPQLTEIREPVEDIENVQSTESVDSLQDVRNQPTPFKEHFNENKEEGLESEADKQIRILPDCEPTQPSATVSEVNIEPTPITSSLKIRPISLADLLEPKLKQMQAARANMSSRLQSSFKELKSKQTSPISISELLASTTNVKEMQSFAVSKPSAQSSSIRIKKTISLSELLSKRSLPVQSLSKLEKIEDLSKIKNVKSGVGLHTKRLLNPESIESRTTSSQVQSVTPSSFNKLELKTGNHSMISSEEAELISLLELPNSNANIKKATVTDLNHESVTKARSTQKLVSSSKPLLPKNNEPSEPFTISSELVRTKTGVSLTSPIISKPSEHGIKRQQSVAVLQPSQSGQNIRVIKKTISVLKSPECRMKQVKTSVPSLELIKINAIQPLQVASEISAKTNSSVELLEANITQLQSLPDSEIIKSKESVSQEAQPSLKPQQSKSDVSTKENSSSSKENISQKPQLTSKSQQIESDISTNENSSSPKENVSQEPQPFLKPYQQSESNDNTKENSSSLQKNVSQEPQLTLKSQQSESNINTKENSSSPKENVSQELQPILKTQQSDSDINTKENSSSRKENDEQAQCSSPEPDSAEPLDAASCSSFEDTETVPIGPDDSIDVVEDAAPIEPVSSAPVPPESITISRSLEPEANGNITQIINMESNSVNVQEAENVTNTKRNETEKDQQSSKRSKRISLRLSRATAIRESKRLQSTANPKATQSNARQSVKQSTNQPKGIPSRSLKCTHKDMYNKNKTLVLTNKEYAKRRLYFVDQETEVNGALTIPLPKVAKIFKWRMIYLNSDFSFFSFVRANYSIKYTDLMDVVKMSSNIKSTITLRNKEFSDHYRHPLFGIWCVPDYQDRLFIGPYLPLEKHNIETLRYLHRKLIDTQIFNKMVGKRGDEKSPTWLYETLPKSYMPASSVVIDITEDDKVKIINPNDNICIIDDDSEPEENEEDFVMESLLCPPFVEKLSEEEVKTNKINRYIMTNIPHLGYFGACQRDSKAIEVFWPDNLRGYRFPNVTFAKNLLILYLTQIFCPIPKDFKINVVIMTHLDLESNKPVDPKYFTQTETYVCGEFGIYQKDAVPNELLQRHGITSVESVLKSEERSEDNDNKMVKLFGLFLMSNEELRKHPEPKNILQWASSETYILKKLGENYESEKGDLRNIIRTNRLKIQETKQNNKTRSKPVVSSGKRKNAETVKVTETIEINDSDEDTRPKSATDDEGPIFKKICTSGKIQTGSSSPKNEGRSLLRPQFNVTGRSLLKVSDTDKQRKNLINNNSNNVSTNSIEISVSNSNVIVNSNNLVIAKMNQKPQTSE